MEPSFWTEFVANNGLVGKSFSLDEQADLSGVGGDLTILTAEDALYELTECWPGLGVARDGYYPVASCDRGSGDYYYVNSNDGPNGPMYRIYHDSVFEDGYKKDVAIALVLANYETLLRYADP